MQHHNQVVLKFPVARSFSGGPCSALWFLLPQQLVTCYEFKRKIVRGSLLYHHRCKKKKNHTTFIVIHKPMNTYMSQRTKSLSLKWLKRGHPTNKKISIRSTYLKLRERGRMGVFLHLFSVVMLSVVQKCFDKKCNSSGVG